MTGAARGALRLVLFGAPGVGKGTQAKALQARRGVPHVSTGDMLRAAIQGGTPLGRQAKAIVERGDLVPDELISELIGERLKQDDLKGGFILDGFPRTVGQAEFLDGALETAKTPLSRVVNLAVPGDEIADRLTGRRVCARCGATYHVRFHPPSAAGTCDACGGPLSVRQDDTLEIIQGRLKVYERQTAPVLEHYRQSGLLVNIDGRGGADEVTDRIERALEGPRG